eukprot:1296276-Pyramimonas_sp.AAC.1
MMIESPRRPSPSQSEQIHLAKPQRRMPLLILKVILLKESKSALGVPQPSQRARAPYDMLDGATYLQVCPGNDFALREGRVDTVTQGGGGRLDGDVRRDQFGAQVQSRFGGVPDQQVGGGGCALR